MTTHTPGAFMAEELASQPAMWEAVSQRDDLKALLPAQGERVAVVGCGTSWFVAQSYAQLRESAGLGVTDAFAASEAPTDRDYDAIVAISRSGTTTEVAEYLAVVTGSAKKIAILGVVDSPIGQVADVVVPLEFADEQSVVQTRFATTALALLRSSTGDSLEQAISDAQAVLAEELDDALVNAEQFSFLGQSWSYGLAQEAALKLREATQAWTEAYPSMEYRHGPIAIAAPGRVTWQFGPAPEGLAADVAATGARFVQDDLDPMASLVKAHRVALQRALAAALDPDVPRNLTRSVILDQ